MVVVEEVVGMDGLDREGDDGGDSVWSRAFMHGEEGMSRCSERRAQCRTGRAEVWTKEKATRG